MASREHNTLDCHPESNKTAAQVFPILDNTKLASHTLRRLHVTRLEFLCTLGAPHISSIHCGCEPHSPSLRKMESSDFTSILAR